MKEKNSQFLWNNSINLVIGGSGLLSKRPTRYNSSNWPSYYKAAKGIKIQSIKNKWYKDFSEFSIGCNLLGYRPKEHHIILKKLYKSPSLTTLPSPEEPYLAEDLNIFLKTNKLWRFTRGGVKVNCYTKNYTQGLIKANSISTIKSEYTLSSFNLYKSLRTAILSSAILIECSSSINSIDKLSLEDFKLHKLILDIGKQAFTKDFIENISTYNINFKRLDISNTLSELIYNKLNPPLINKTNPSKVKFNSEINLISGGWKGLPGDIVVDNAYIPRFVIGIINTTFTIDPIYTSFKKWLNSN